MKGITIALVGMMFFMTSGLSAGQQQGVSLGIHILVGGRYDNVRKCVGVPAGEPGGPIGEVYLDIRVPVSERGAVGYMK